jgi:uncharacterized protein (UPF0333 family)
MNRQKAQISIEYMIVVGFVTVLILGLLAVGYFYSATIKEKIKFNQLSSFSSKVISSAETVFQKGAPSKITFTAYLPPAVKQIEILDNEIVFTLTTSSGTAKMSFSSDVPLQGSLSTSEGVKRIKIEAQESSALITEG